MTRLLEIATQLAQHRTARRAVEIRLSHLQSDYAARLLAIRPAGGWQGKNEVERKDAGERAESNDETLRAIRAQQAEEQEQIDALETLAENLSDERRAIEAQIRQNTADAISAFAGAMAQRYADKADDDGDYHIVNAVSPAAIETAQTYTALDDDFPF